jgi:hypothetical protein
MMHHHTASSLLSAIARGLFILVLAFSYCTIVAGLFGMVSAKTVTLVTLGGAMIGCVAAFTYLVTGTRDLQQRAH